MAKKYGINMASVCQSEKEKCLNGKSSWWFCYSCTKQGGNTMS